MPIVFNGKVTGVAEFFSRDIREPGDELLGMLTALGEQIGQFIARKRTESTCTEPKRRPKARTEPRASSWQ